MNIKVLSGLLAMGAVFVGGLAYRPAVSPLSTEEGASAPPAMREVPVAIESVLPQDIQEELTVAENTALESPTPPSPTPESNALQSSPAQAALAPELADAGWAARVGNGRGVWVSVSAQTLSLLEGGSTIWSGTCATAANGVGAEMGSQKTPLGWHVVSEKMGDEAPWGQVFRSRAPTKEIWKPGGSTKEDLVLTRLLWLDGLEPGKNKGKNAAGKNVDSKERCIYIHGTNAEALLGTPSSHGCIRLKNDDVIKVYDLLPVGTPVLITE